MGRLTVTARRNYYRIMGNANFSWFALLSCLLLWIEKYKPVYIELPVRIYSSDEHGLVMTFTLPPHMRLSLREGAINLVIEKHGTSDPNGWSRSLNPDWLQGMCYHYDDGPDTDCRFSAYDALDPKSTFVTLFRGLHAADRSRIRAFSDSCVVSWKKNEPVEATQTFKFRQHSLQVGLQLIASTLTPVPPPNWRELVE